MKLLNFADKIIEYSFYTLLFLVPLIFWKETSELFEFNKMWLTFIITVFVSLAWIVKMIVMKKFWIQKTPLDIPIALFLGSQIISTVSSLDPYVSLFGYYSRFNGGLLSIISYVILYYAFLSNFDLKTKAKEIGKKILGVSLASGAVVALWGLPSHFGFDPTCYLFRGSLDVSCWTADFQPKVRIFSTMGQPAWLGAYLAILSPLALWFALNSKRKLLAICYLLLSLIFYVDILFTKSRAALIAFWISEITFLGAYYWLEIKKADKNINFNSLKPHLKIFAPFLIAIIVISAIILNPIATTKSAEPTGTFASGGGGTESGKIRLLVWEGALKIWTHYPLFGSGVETFAYSYYKYRPVAHNLTSEWNYLYNKAHNEFLNYLATTGIVGFGAYLFLIGKFLYMSGKKLLEDGNPKPKILLSALVAGYISILITNFFGFSVVITNLYLFLIPALVFLFFDFVKPKEIFVFNFSREKTLSPRLSFLQKVDIFVAFLVSIYLIGFLINFWQADQAYSLGSNLSRAGEYDSAYLKLQEATSKAPFEPVFKDELAGNDAILAISLLSSLSDDDKTASRQAEIAQSLARESIIATTQVTDEHPNNVVFWKTKVRVFYTLSQVDSKYTKLALEAIKKAQELAPTDARVSYNLALIYGQINEIDNAISTLKETVKLKPDYIDAHYALGLFYRQLATDKNGRVINEELEEKAVAEMNYILKNIDPNNEDAKEALKAWTGGQ